MVAVPSQAAYCRPAQAARIAQRHTCGRHTCLRHTWPAPHLPAPHLLAPHLLAPPRPRLWPRGFGPFGPQVCEPQPQGEAIHNSAQRGSGGAERPLAVRSLAWPDDLVAAFPAGAGRARSEGAAAPPDRGGAHGGAAAARPPHRAQDPHRAPLRVHAARGSASLLLPPHRLQDTHRAPRGRRAHAARAFAPSRLCLRAEPRPRGRG